MGRCGVIQLVCLLDVLPWNDVLPYSIANMTSVEYIAWVWASDTTGSIVVDLKKPEHNGPTASMFAAKD